MDYLAGENLHTQCMRGGGALGSRRCLPWGPKSRFGAERQGLPWDPQRETLEGIWWETSQGKSHQERRQLGFTPLKIPGSWHTAA